MFDIWRYFCYGEKKHLWRVYLWMALGTLTKGPIAVAVPLIASLSYLLLSKESIEKYKAYINPVGWLIYLACVAPWLIAVYLEQGTGFFEGFILEHNVKRFSSTREDHGGSLFYYVLILPLIVLPFSGLIFSWLRRSVAYWQDPFKRFLALWFAVIFVVFSLSKTQLPHYILNACIPLFILFVCGKGLCKRNHWLYLFPLFIALVLFVLPLIIGFAAKNTGGFDGAMMSRHEQVFDHLYSGAAILLMVSVLAVLVLPRLQNWQRLVCIGLLLNLFTFNSFARVASKMQQEPLHQIIKYLEETLPNTEVVAYRMHMPSFSLYRNRITPLRAPKPGELAITRVDRLKELDTAINGSPIKILFRSGGLILLKVLPPEGKDPFLGVET